MVKPISSLPEDLKKKLRELVYDTHRVIVENTPIDTGRLRQSIIVEETGNGYVIGTNMPYAEYVELGIEPHEIKPREKKALYWQGARHPVKRVRHPGFQGSHMFLKGVTYFNKELEKRFRI